MMSCPCGCILDVLVVLDSKTPVGVLVLAVTVASCPCGHILDALVMWDSETPVEVR